jgi:hypothetical protein
MDGQEGLTKVNRRRAGLKLIITENSVSRSGYESLGLYHRCDFSWELDLRESSFWELGQLCGLDIEQYAEDKITKHIKEKKQTVVFTACY